MKRTYCVVMEFEVEVRDLTYETAMARYDERDRNWREMAVQPLDDDVMARPTPEAVEDQKALLAALLADRERLDRYMRNEVAIHIADVIEGKEPADAFVDIVRPIVETLPPRARHRFRESFARDMFVEDAEDFFESFKTEIVSLNID